MIRQQKHIVSWILAVHILLSSVGLALHKRICQMPEMGTTVSYFVPGEDNCCAQKSARKHCHKPSNRKPINPCCQFESDFWQVDYSTPLSLGGAIDFSPLWVLMDNSFFYQPSNLLIFNQLAFDFYTDTSPPRSGREILLRSGILLI
ncbi:MAG: hypothetical protein MUE85_11530 [Microscillaceae bacterium]|jgi:hypothetical protein|nr:hypothetical protein [Microscillaceae bacterium]